MEPRPRAGLSFSTPLRPTSWRRRSGQGPRACERCPGNGAWRARGQWRPRRKRRRTPGRSGPVQLGPPDVDTRLPLRKACRRVKGAVGKQCEGHGEAARPCPARRRTEPRAPLCLPQPRVSQGRAGALPVQGGPRALQQSKMASGRSAPPLPKLLWGQETRRCHVRLRAGPAFAPGARRVRGVARGRPLVPHPGPRLASPAGRRSPAWTCRDSRGPGPWASANLRSRACLAPPPPVLLQTRAAAGRPNLCRAGRPAGDFMGIPTPSVEKLQGRALTEQLGRVPARRTAISEIRGTRPRTLCML